MERVRVTSDCDESGRSEKDVRKGEEKRRLREGVGERDGQWKEGEEGGRRRRE